MTYKLISVFFDKNGNPFKDIAREVPCSIVNGAFIGASKTTKIYFYYDKLLNEDDEPVTWVAVSKLPNGKIGSKVLESYLDEEINEHYALLELDSFYTQYKGDVYLALQGYQGGVQVLEDSETGIYTIVGTPTIQTTGNVRLNILYAPQFIGSGETQNVNFQQILADLSTKLGIRTQTILVNELPTIGETNVFYVIENDSENPNKTNIYIWNGTTQSYVWVGDNSLFLGNYYTTEQATTFENGIKARVTAVENELSSVASGSPAGVFATLSDLTTADPSHDRIYVVTATGNWYYWDGTQWASGGTYQATQIANGSITRVKLDNDLKEKTDNGLKAKIVFNDFFSIDGNLIPNAVLDKVVGCYATSGADGKIEYHYDNSHLILYKFDYIPNKTYYVGGRFLCIVDINNNVLYSSSTISPSFDSSNYTGAKYIYLSMYDYRVQKITIGDKGYEQNNFVNPIFNNNFKCLMAKANYELKSADILETKTGYYAHMNTSNEIAFDSNENYNCYRVKYEKDTIYGVAYGRSMRYFDVIMDTSNPRVCYEQELSNYANSGNYDYPKYIWITLGASYTSQKIYKGKIDNKQFSVIPTSAKSYSISATCADATLPFKLCLFSGSSTLKGSITINSTKIVIMRNMWGTEESTEVEHGLTIQNNIQVNADVINGSQLKIRLTSGGEVFETTSAFGTTGLIYPDVQTESNAPISLSLSITDIDKKNWVFGDSYVSNAQTRWVYYLYGSDYKNYMIDGYSGENSIDAVPSLKSLLKLGRPENVCWFLGMNDGNDPNSSTPYSVWLNGINEVIALSKEYGFNLILATIPSVPTVYNEGKNNYVRNSGYQYVDFAKAVGANSSGIWFAGMLSDDNIHPSVNGAKALYAQLLADFPQLKVK